MLMFAPGVAIVCVGFAPVGDGQAFSVTSTRTYVSYRTLTPDIP